MGKDRSILFIPPVHWNYYSYRDQELPLALAHRDVSCVYLNPVAYKGCEKADRFAHLDPREVHPNIKFVDRKSPLRKSFPELLVENIMNISTLRKYRPKAVISSDHLMSVGPCIYCKIKGIRFIFDVTDNWEEADRSMAGKFYKYVIKPLLAQYSYAVTCVSKHQFEYFSKKRRRNTLLISNGINPRLEKQLETAGKPDLRKPEVNFIGSLRDWYDFDLLIDLFLAFPEITLNIYGTGPLYPYLLTKTSGLPHIHCHGNLESHKTAEKLHRSLFGILPLKMNVLNQSTCPIKLFDYWGASKAVISTPVREVKRVGGDALLYATTLEEFIQGVQKLLDSREYMHGLGAKGKERIKLQHNYQSISEQFINILFTK